MTENLIIIIVLSSLAIVLFIIFFAAVWYENARKKSAQGKKLENDWLFANFSDKMYDALFKDKDPDQAAAKLGINAEKYRQNCLLIKQPANIKHLVMDYVYALLILLGFVILAVFVDMVFFIPGFVLGIFLMRRRTAKAKTKANKMKNAMSEELPQFLDILQAELQVGLPIETAIFTICTKKKSILSTEFLEAMNDMKLGLSDWPEALEAMARKYKIKNLNLFVSDITTSYRLGVSVADAVTRKAKEIQQAHLLDVKEAAGKATNAVLLPTVLFQMVPMILYLMVPIFLQISEGLT